MCMGSAARSTTAQIDSTRDFLRAACQQPAEPPHKSELLSADSRGIGGELSSRGQQFAGVVRPSCVLRRSAAAQSADGGLDRPLATAGCGDTPQDGPSQPGAQQACEQSAARGSKRGSGSRVATTGTATPDRPAGQQGELVPGQTPCPRLLVYRAQVNPTVPSRGAQTVTACRAATIDATATRPAHMLVARRPSRRLRLEMTGPKEGLAAWLMAKLARQSVEPLARRLMTSSRLTVHSLIAGQCEL